MKTCKYCKKYFGQLKRGCTAATHLECDCPKCQGMCTCEQQELADLRQQLEVLQMQLCACGVVALADTVESAKKAREMSPEFWTPSCHDVARRVDECIDLRRIKQAAEEWQQYLNSNDGNGIMTSDGACRMLKQILKGEGPKR